MPCWYKSSQASRREHHTTLVVTICENFTPLVLGASLTKVEKTSRLHYIAKFSLIQMALANIYNQHVKLLYRLSIVSVLTKTCKAQFLHLVVTRGYLLLLWSLLLLTVGHTPSVSFLFQFTNCSFDLDCVISRERIRFVPTNGHRGYQDT